MVTDGGAVRCGAMRCGNSGLAARAAGAEKSSVVAQVIYDVVRTAFIVLRVVVLVAHALTSRSITTTPRHRAHGTLLSVGGRQRYNRGR